MTTLVAYHNDPAVKAKYLARVAAHRAADALIQGVGWNSGRGCAVGCTLETYDHSRYPIELGIPEHIAYLEDQIFEGLPIDLAMAWPERFLLAIPIGANLSGVWPAFAQWILVDSDLGVIRHAGDQQRVRDVIQQVADLYRDGGTPKEFAAAAAAAKACPSASAAAWAAAVEAAVEAADAEACPAAVWAAAWAAALAAERAAMATAMKKTWYIAASDKLVELLGKCWVPIISAKE